MTLRTLLRSSWIRVLLLCAAFASLAWTFSDQWRELQVAMGDAAHDLTLNWTWLGLASVIVLLTYAMLVQSWRLLLAEWGGHLRYGEAVQIWTIANLGKWIPGKIWQVGALSMMAADAGVSGVAAAGAALLGTALNIGAGLGIAAITSAGGLDAIRPGLRQVAIVLALLFVVGVGVLPFVLPSLLDRFARWRGIPLSDRRLSHRTIWVATAINAASWVAYGAAFACFTRGLLPSVSGNPSTFIAVYTASYVLGYLVLFSPGGLGIREAAMIALLVAFGMAGKGDAAILSVASRVWLLVLEVLPGVACLLLLSPLKRAALRRPG